MAGFYSANQIDNKRWGKSQLEWTANKLLQGAGVGSDPTEIDVPGGNGGGDVCLTVAAADTPTTLKNRADYVGDGTHDMGDVAGDEAEINTALGVSDTVILCPGTFWINDSIVMASNKSLIGSGSGTIIKIRDSKNANLNMIVNSDAGNGNSCIVVKNLKLDGNKGIQSSGTQHGVYFTRVSSLSTAPGCRIEGCFIENFRNNGTYLYTQCMNNIILGNIIANNNGYGIYIQSSYRNNTISGNNLIGTIATSQYGIYLSAAYCTSISGNTFQGFKYSAIRLSASLNNTISGNVAGDCDEGVYLTSTSDKNTIVGNTFSENIHYGIRIESSNNNIISGNNCAKNKFDGIRLTTSHSNIVSGNNFFENSQQTNNTYDNIFLTGSDYNLIQGNVCRQGALANKPRYGINISDDTSDKNCLIGNDLYDSGSTDDLNDVPTTNPTLKHDNRNLAGTGWLDEI